MARVAMIVYDCIPDAGSDPGHGWHSVVSAARGGHQIHALTKASNQNAIESVPAFANVTWHYLDVPESTLGVSTGRSFGDTVHLWRWLREARTRCEELVRSGEVELTHFVTFTAFWMPVPIEGIGVPHVFGPVGGGEEIPPVLASGNRERLASFARRTFQTSMTRNPTWRRLLASPSTTTISASIGTTERLNALGVAVFETWRTSCLTDTLMATIDGLDPIRSSSTRLVSSGRQVRWKGHDLLVDALPSLVEKYPDIELVLVGGGPENTNLRERAEQHKLADRIEFREKVPREEERRLIAGADCFVLPSRRDAGSTLPPLVQLMGVPLAAFSTGALPERTGGYAHLADPAQHGSPALSLAAAIEGALGQSEEQGEAARTFAIEHYNETAMQHALNRWYEHALASA